MSWLPIHQLEAKYGRPETGRSFGPLEHRNCPLCDSDRKRTVLVDQYYPLADLDHMSIVECECCSLMFTDPIPTKNWLDTFLNPKINIWWDQPVWTTLEWQGQNSTAKFADGLKIIRQLAPSGTLIDVGTGPGLFVRMAEEAGYQAVGLDVLPEGVRRAADHGIRVIADDLSSPRFNGQFDIVTLWCVIAHEPAFAGLVRRCHGVLKPGGMVLIETPNMTLWRLLRTPRAWLRKLTGSNPDHDSLAAYLHINHFTTRTLTDLFSRCGFGEIRFHLVSNYADQRGPVDLGKRLLFAVSGSRINVSFPLVATARKL